MHETLDLMLRMELQESSSLHVREISDAITSKEPPSRLDPALVTNNCSHAKNRTRPSCGPLTRRMCVWRKRGALSPDARGHAVRVGEVVVPAYCNPALVERRVVVNAVVRRAADRDGTRLHVCEYASKWCMRGRTHHDVDSRLGCSRQN